jgi:hypothetical protein
MDVFKQSFMDTYSSGHSEGVEYDWPCSVRIDEEMIVVEYSDDQDIVVYRGSSSGPGHYRLQKDGGRGDATLHRFPGGKILEGFWIEDVQQGMWRIRLKN